MSAECRKCGRDLDGDFKCGACSREERCAHLEAELAALREELKECKGARNELNDAFESERAESGRLNDVVDALREATELDQRHILAQADQIERLKGDLAIVNSEGRAYRTLCGKLAEALEDAECEVRQHITMLEEKGVITAVSCLGYLQKVLATYHASEKERE